MPPTEPIERKWRVGSPTAGVPGSLYDFVRRYLVAQGGRCVRDDLNAALLADPVMKKRLEAGRGFMALLRNIYHSGDLTLSENRVIASARTYRRVGRN